MTVRNICVRYVTNVSTHLWKHFSNYPFPHHHHHRRCHIATLRRCLCVLKLYKGSHTATPPFLSPRQRFASIHSYQDYNADVEEDECDGEAHDSDDGDDGGGGENGDDDDEVMIRISSRP